MPRLKVGIIGAGMAFERLHYPAYQRLKDQYQIVAVCDADLARAKTWAERLHLGREQAYADFHAMLARVDLDVVDIMVPIPLNYQVTEEVARLLAGKPKGIICEKPLAPTLFQAQAAKDLPRKYGLPIMIAENYRYSEEVNLIRDLVRAGRIGEVYYFIYNRVVNFPEDMLADKFESREWRQHPEFPGGTITDTAVHDLGGLRHIFGPIDCLQAFARPQKVGFSPYSVVNVNLRFKSGLTGQFSFFCAGKEMQRPLTGFRIFGSRGMIYLEERDAGSINLAYNDGTSEQIPYRPQEGYYRELLNFYNAMTGTETISVTPEIEYGDLKTVHDILKSISEQRIVPVDE